MNKITKRRYKILTDFPKVHAFLTDIYSIGNMNSYLLPQFFEYAQSHSYFNAKYTHCNMLWEDDGELIAIACYEMDIGECCLAVRDGFDYLLPEMIDHAESELYASDNGKRKLTFWVMNNETVKQELLAERGYNKVYSEPIKIFCYENPFREVMLPDGFTLMDDLTDADPVKIYKCCWQGFDHGEIPADYLDHRDNWEGNIHVGTSPNYRADLGTIIVAPDGEYACLAGMWIDETNKYAYLEPLCTIPQYRRMGLATIALTNSMKKTKTLGAEYCFGGGMDFYTAIGFEIIAYRETWEKIY